MCDVLSYLCLCVLSCLVLCCDVTYVVPCTCVVLEATIGRLLQLSISHPRLVNCEPTRLAVTQRETRTTQASLDLTCEGEVGAKGRVE